MIEIIFNQDEMKLVVEGMHKLWALKSEMSIPIGHIKSARINRGEITKPEGWRLPGCYIPGIITAGTYRSHGDKVFWDVCDFEKTIIIDLKNCDYSRLIIEVHDPEKTINEINSHLT